MRISACVGPWGVWNDRLEGDALLKEIVMTVGGGNGVEVGVGGGELNSLPREGVKRLEEESFALMREGLRGCDRRTSRRGRRPWGRRGG